MNAEQAEARGGAVPQGKKIVLIAKHFGPNAGGEAIKAYGRLEKCRDLSAVGQNRVRRRDDRGAVMEQMGFF